MANGFYDIDSFEPNRSIGYLTKRLAKVSTTRIEAAFAGHELSLTHWVAMAMLRHGMADTGADLARWIGHDSGATTRLIDGLEARGLIERTRCCNDRRVVRLACTAAGLAQFDTLTPLMMGVWNDVLSGFDPAEVETFIAMLTRLIAAFEARGGAVPGIAA